MRKSSAKIKFTVAKILLLLCAILMASSFFALDLYADNDEGEKDGAFLEPKESEDYSEKYRELFRLYSDIELMESKKAKYEKEILELKKDIEKSIVRLEKLGEEIELLLCDYADIMRSRQMYGEVSSVKLLISAGSVSEFMQRVGILSEISATYHRATNELDATLTEESATKEKLETQRAVLEKTKAELEESIALKKENAEKLEAFLKSKGEEKARYEEELKKLSKQWEELRPLFSASIKSLEDLVAAGGLPNDVVELDVSIFGVKAIVKEEVFNSMLDDAFQNMKDSVKLEFDMKDDGIYVRVPSHDVLLYGSFEASNQELVYRVERGTFNGIKMGDSALEDLFLNRKLVFDLSSLIGKNQLKNCKIYDGYLEIGVKLNF